MRVLWFVLLPLFLFGQSYSPAGFDLPFASGNDTLFRADTLTSSTILYNESDGETSLGFEFETVGDSAGPIDVYYMGALSGLSWGVPFDSIGVDTMHIATVDSAYVDDGNAFWIPLSKEDWWSFHDEANVILISTEAIDTVYVKCRIRDQRK